MIQKESYLEVGDNSGAKVLKCIHLVGSTRKRYGYIGDIIRCSVKVAAPGGQVKKGDVVTAVIVRTAKEFRREDGSYIRFSENAAVLIKSVDDTTPLGTRIFGPIAREIKAVSAKIPSLAPEVF